MREDGPYRHDDLLFSTESGDGMGEKKEERADDSEDLELGVAKEGEDSCHVDVSSAVSRIEDNPNGI